MEFREQLQMTNNDLRYIDRIGNVGTGSCTPSRYLESARIKVSGGLLRGDAPRCARIKPDSSQCYPSDNNVGTGR